MNVIDLIEADHRHVENLFAQYEGESESAIKNDILTAIIRDLMHHIAMEETHVYPVVEAVDPTEVEHAMEEHQAIRDALLAAKGTADEDRAPLIATLQGEVEHHVSEEESPGGLLELLAGSGADLEALGLTCQTYKAELRGMPA